ncbi:MAG: hypothetical protein ABR987_03685 [Terracidiphilus sp.]|jgi:hypothetical protein
MAILTTIIVGIVGKIAADEAKVWFPFFSQRLLSFAVERLPSDQRERCREEWAADLLSYPSELTRFCRALGMCWAALQMESTPVERVQNAHISPSVAQIQTANVPRTLLESAGQRLAGECTVAEREVLKRAWDNPNDTQARQAANAVFSVVRMRLSKRK